MQTVCDQNLFGMSPMKTEFRTQALPCCNRMNPAEVRLEWQVFLGGSAVSGLLLLGMHFFGM